jgi:hypothetical protein
LLNQAMGGSPSVRMESRAVGCMNAYNCRLALLTALEAHDAGCPELWQADAISSPKGAAAEIDRFEPLKRETSSNRSAISD